MSARPESRIDGLVSRYPYLTSALVGALVGAPFLLAARGSILGHGPTAVLWLVALACLPYGLVALFPKHGVPWTVAFGIALVIGGALVVSPPLFSDDIYRYAWDGRVLLAGIDPYRYAPDDPALGFLRDDEWLRINHRKIATVYPLGAQAVFAVAAACAQWLSLSPIWVLKGAALAVHLAIGAVLFRATRSGTWAALYLWNPLALVESAQSGHLDCWAGLGLLMAAVMLQRNKLGAALASALVATAVKLVGLVALPALGRRHRPTALVLGASAVIWLAPLFGAGASDQRAEEAGVVHYAARWEGNPGGFRVLRAAAATLLDVAGGVLDWPPGEVRGSTLDQRLPGFGPGVDRLSGGAEKKGGRVDKDATAGRDRWAGLIARGWVAVLGLLLALALALAQPPLLALRWTLLAALLMLPTVHPWYLLWLLPIEVAAGRLTGLAWSALILTAYIPLEMYLQSGIWVENPLIAWAQYGVVGLLVVLELPWIRSLFPCVGSESL